MARKEREILEHTVRTVAEGAVQADVERELEDLVLNCPRCVTSSTAPSGP